MVVAADGEPCAIIYCGLSSDSYDSAHMKGREVCTDIRSLCNVCLILASASSAARRRAEILVEGHHQHAAERRLEQPVKGANRAGNA